MKLLVSLHDVTPFHLNRIRRAEAVFAELGLARVAYLLVPEYHGGHPGAADPGFIRWCRGSRPFEVQWQLHGWHHLETPEERVEGGFSDAWKRRVLTAGEGEFLALPPEAQRRRLADGLASYRACLERDPEVFVAPAWLFNAHLPPLLHEIGIARTEDQRKVYRTDTGAGVASPVITWATRTVLRKYGSLVVCPLLARAFAAAPFLRVAMHPFDFDHASTVRSIRSVLRRVMRGREQAFPTDVPIP